LTTVVTRVAIAAMRHRAMLLSALLLAGCTTNATRIERLAQAAAMTRSVLDAEGYRSLVFMKAATGLHSGPLAVFIEGDGRPWRAGVEPSADPTTGNPIALKLLAQTPGPAAYVTRPCYHELPGQRCTPQRWTSGRYSEEVVSSMTAAVRSVMQQVNAQDVVLVGYSGGGVLAVLIAERLDNVAAVVTVGANLDIDAWTRHHRYLPLTGSLNPALSNREHRWPELHLYGANDAVVPSSTAAAYFQRYPQAQQRVIDGYDHVCCWVETWPQSWKTYVAGAADDST
jgi:dienelactone hydrolase